MLQAMGLTVAQPNVTVPLVGVAEQEVLIAPPHGPARSASASPGQAVPAPFHGAQATARATLASAAVPARAGTSQSAPKSVAIQARANSSEAWDALGWQPLRQAVADCRACELCSTRKQTVFGAGHHGAHWMIVGEAPGETEDQQGEPFVGESGRLLDAMLHALQLTRGDGATSPAQQVYIANALKCRPPKNRNPKPEEMAQCEPFLMRQLALVKPRIIVAMGRFAVQSLLRTDEAIGRLRGQVHQLNGTPLVVTYHPAYLLRNPIDKARAWDDWCLAAQVVAAEQR
jgi:uracil-DNA glycosylase